MNRELRTFTLDRAASRSSPAGIRFRGHAAVFGKKTWIGPPGRGFWEEVAAGAFDRALEEDDVRLLLEHDPHWILGRTGAGTLRLSADKAGLAVDSDFPDTTYAADAVASLDRGDLSEMSFAFDPRRDERGDPVGQELVEQRDGSWLRRLTDVRLFDVSIVAYPAYEGTDAALRAVEARRGEFRTNQLATLRTRLEAAWKGVTA
jgi:hypothetical protein